jgi:hypothetical protein
MSLECLQKEQLRHKMASAGRLLVSTHFVTYCCHHLLVSHPTKMNMYTAFQNENGVSCLTVIVNKRQLIMHRGGRNHKWHSLHAGILKYCDEEYKVILYFSTYSCFDNFTVRVYYQY